MQQFLYFIIKKHYTTIKVCGSKFNKFSVFTFVPNIYLMHIKEQH